MRLARNVVGWVVPIGVLGLLLLPVPARAQDKKYDEVLKQMEAAKLTLKKAVEAAETVSKGKAVAAYTSMKGAKAELLVYCEVDGKSMEVPVDVKTGAAGKVAEATGKEEKGVYITRAKEIAKQLAEAKPALTLIKLIEAAEKSSPKAEAVSIKPKLEGGRFDFTLHVKASGKWQDIVVDGKTGKVKSGEGKTEKKTEQKAPPAAGKGGKGGGQPAQGGKGAQPQPGGKGGGRRP